MKKLTILFFAITQLTLAQAPRELRVIFEVAGQDSGALLGTYVKGVGDLNKDGYDDVAVSAPGQLLTYVYYGAETMNQQPNLILEGGGTITSGDFNNDGWIDLAIEKWFRDTVNIFLGNVNMDTIPNIILTEPSDYFGYQALTSGDINGDAYDDLIIGTLDINSMDSTLYTRGRILVYAGGNTINPEPEIILLGDTIRAGLGHSISLGDINGDGSKDIIALGLNSTTPGSNNWFFYISIYLGDPNFNLQRNYYLDSRNIAGGFRDHLSCFDADGDNIDDILVNKVYIFKGGNQLDTIPTYYIPPPNNDTISFGSFPWVSGGGDFNGDGFKDMLISRTEGYPFGVPGFYLYLNRLNHPGQYVAYRVFSEYWWHSKLYGRPENAGDVNNDGVDDIITSSPMEYLNNEGFFGIYSGDSTIVTDVEDINEELFKDFNLKQNYPNPFNPQTIIEYTIEKGEYITIKIYDALGKEVLTLINKEEKSAGNYSIKWGGTDEYGNKLSSGVYYYQLTTTSGVQTKKALYIK